MHRKPYAPYLDAGVKGWIVSTAKKNYWRVAHYYDLADLIQDGYLAYAICYARYGEKVKSRSHFMALFKRVYWSRIIDAAKKRSEASGDLWCLVIDGREKAWMPHRQAMLTAKALKNKGHDVSLKPTGSEVKVSDLYPTVGETSALEFLAGGMAGAGDITLMLETAPAEIKMFLSDLQEGYLAGRHPRKLRDGKRETTNEWLNRMLSTSGIDYESELRSLLV